MPQMFIPLQHLSGYLKEGERVMRSLIWKDCPMSAFAQALCPENFRVEERP